MQKKKKEIILFFGRCNIPTKAHVIVWKQVKQIAIERNCIYKIYITDTHNTSSDPLHPKTKIKWCKTIAPDIVFTLTGGKSGIKTPIDAIIHLSKKGYTHITIVGGDDRKDIVEKIHQYIDSSCTLSFVSAGYRAVKTDIKNSKQIPQTHISGTLLREYIYSLMRKDEAFALMPESLTHKQKVQLYYDVLLESGYISKSSKIRNAARDAYLTSL